MLVLKYLSEDSNDGGNKFTLVHVNGILSKLLGILYIFLRSKIENDIRIILNY